ncbi:MAG: YggS family pyridoxal phosphate-dependent enzyme [Cyclobacteriaceae bacterium]|nr:YggS family pyridoxal phosphate-dependent enzyme [Cyclobacteriaceae bacterium]
MTIKNNIVRYTQSLPPGCALIAVSKTQPIEKIQEAYAAGQRAFGENKAQEMARKHEQLPKDIQWHMIGHLQTNKVKYIAPFVHLIHGVDSLKLLTEIDKQAGKNNRIIPCLLQVHIAEEETKFGFSIHEVQELLRNDALSNLNHIRIIGLMGMATFTDNMEQVQKEFRSLKQFFTTLQNQPLPKQVVMQELSMGMSGDYEIAVKEGSTMVRIGTSIFGERNYASVNLQ